MRKLEEQLKRERARRPSRGRSWDGMTGWRDKAIHSTGFALHKAPCDCQKQGGRAYRVNMTENAPLEIPGSHVSRAKARVARWADLTGRSPELRRKLLHGVEAIAHELPLREHWKEVTTIRLDHEQLQSSISISTDNYLACRCGESLVVSTLVPGWGYGWHSILPDENVHDILSWFMHYVRQYIHRSYIANTLMAVWSQCGIILHPFGSKSLSYRYGPVVWGESEEQALEIARIKAIKAWGCDADLLNFKPEKLEWMERNTLDPFVHQSIFHFLRGQRLRASEFDVEAIVAFDVVLQLAVSFIQKRCALPKQPDRQDICDILSIGSIDREILDFIYFVRNNFGAHAGGWRWWDQYEIFDEYSVSEIGLATETMLVAVADHEKDVRAVESAPKIWAHWFFENFDILWDAVWFEAIDKWNVGSASQKGSM